MRDQDKYLPEHFNEMYAAWALGEDNRYLPRLRGIDPQGTGADYHYADETTYFKGIERARAMDREDCVLGQGTRRLVNTVLREPTNLDPDTGDAGADTAILDAFNAWGNDRYLCDVRGIATFPRMSKQVLLSVIRDGDIGAYPLDVGSLQPFESHRIRTPKKNQKNTVHGVQLDPITAAPVGYWVTKESADSYKNTVSQKDMMPMIPARDDKGFPNFFHVYNPTRVSQTRGISAFLPITYVTGMHNDLQFGMMVKAQASAFFSLFLEKSADVVAQSVPQKFGEQTTETGGGGQTTTFEKLKPGAIVRGNPGEKLQGFSPNIPNPEFFPHTVMLASIIAVNLDMPGMMFLLDPSKTNFSGWRGAIDQAKAAWINLQQMLIEMWYDPVYLWKLRQIIAADSALQKIGRQSGVRLGKHLWRPCRWPYIEPFKDAQAEAKRLENGLCSDYDVAGEKGRDYDDLAPAITKGKRKLIESAIADAAAINAKHPEAGVTWLHLMPSGFRDKLLEASAAVQAPAMDENGDMMETDERNAADREAA